MSNILGVTTNIKDLEERILDFRDEKLNIKTGEEVNYWHKKTPFGFYKGLNFTVDVCLPTDKESDYLSLVFFNMTNVVGQALVLISTVKEIIDIYLKKFPELTFLDSSKVKITKGKYMFIQPKNEITLVETYSFALAVFKEKTI